MFQKSSDFLDKYGLEATVFLICVFCHLISIHPVFSYEKSLLHSSPFDAGQGGVTGCVTSTYLHHYLASRSLMGDSYSNSIARMRIWLSHPQDPVGSRDPIKQDHIQQLEDSLRKHPDDFVLRSELANKLTILGRYQDAEAHFKKLLAQELSARNRWAVRTNFGNYQLIRDRVALAESYYKEALQDYPAGIKTYLNLGTLYSALNDSVQAVASYGRFIEAEEYGMALDILGLAEDEAELKGAPGKKKKKNKNLRSRIRKNLKKAGKGKGKKNRPAGRKGGTMSQELSDFLYWAEVK